MNVQNIRQKQYDLVIKNVLSRGLVEVRMLGIAWELRHTRTQQYGRRSTRFTLIKVPSAFIQKITDGPET